MNCGINNKNQDLYVVNFDYVDQIQKKTKIDIRPPIAKRVKTRIFNQEAEEYDNSQKQKQTFESPS